jgi:hypothetical protein
MKALSYIGLIMSLFGLVVPWASPALAKQVSAPCVVASVFDAYLDRSHGRHAVAV